MYFTYLLLLGLSIVCNSILLVLFHLRTQKNNITLSLFLLLGLVNLWFIPKFITNAFQPTGYFFETLSRISALGYIFVPIALIIFTLSYSSFHKIIQKLSFWIILFLPPLCFLYLSWTTNLIGVHDFSMATRYPWGFETPTGKLWPYYIGWYNLMALIAVGILFHHYRTMIDHSKKRQTLYFILAIITPLVINTIAVGILPIFNIFLFPIGLILLDVVTILGISLVYHYGLFEVSPHIILSNINHVILTVNNKGSIVQVNPYAEKIFKMDANNLIATRIDKILFLKHKGKTKTNHTMKLLQLVLSKGKSMTFESFSVLINNKQELTDIISITPLYTNNAIIGANIFLRDTRKEKIREKQKDDYLSMLFHELKSPMTSIKIYNQILLENLKNSTKENRSLVAKVDVQLDRLTKLTNDFFELSRLQAGKLTLTKEYFAIDDLVNNIVETMRITFNQNTFRVKGGTNSIVYADKDKIEQILLNFINNAVKFSPEHTEIIIHLASDSKKVTVGVQDYGKGIEQKFHKKIFERFFQVAPPSKEKIGLGIGLSIASIIIKAHQGKIWVDSHVSKGSTFYFSLPVNK